MSNNSPIVSIRVPPLWLAAIDAEIQRVNARRKNRSPITRTTWILEACAQRMNHLSRSKRPSKPIISVGATS